MIHFGIPLMILSCTCSNLLASEFEISGRVTGIKSRDPSSKGGINSRPRFIIIGILMSSAKILIPSVFSISSPSYQRFVNPFQASVYWVFIIVLKFSLHEKGDEHRARVSTRIASTIRMNVLVYASG
jgi:hypothetical protein